MGTSNKTFLPRLRRDIQSITVNDNGTRYLICCSDNSIRIFDGVSKNQLLIVHGLNMSNHTFSSFYLLSEKQRFLEVLIILLSWPLSKGSRADEHEHELDLIVEPRNHLVVSRSNAGSLQFYDCLKDRHALI